MYNSTNYREETDVGEALATIATIPIRPNQSRLYLHIGLSADEEFDQFEVHGKIADSDVILATAGADFTTPLFPVLDITSDLNSLAANASAALLLDVAGLREVSLKAACAAATAAASTLTAAANATGGVFGTETLTATDVIVGGVASAGVLTGTTIAVGDTVTIGSVVYTFVADVGYPPVPNQVLVGATDSDSLDNLIAAINGGQGIGKVYSWDTVPHSTVAASAGAGDTMDVEAVTRGEAGDLIATTDTLSAGGFGAGTLEGGVDAETVTIGSITYTFDAAPLIDEAYHVLVGADVDETLDNLEVAINGDTGSGTLYGTGTVAHPLVTGENQGDDSLDITTIEQTGATIATTETCGDAGWGNATVQNGVTPGTLTIGNVTYIFDASTLVDEPNHVLVGGDADATLENLELAITFDGGAGTNEGTAYGTGTVANPDVTGANQGDDTLDLAALVAGNAGNDIPTLSTDANLTFSAAVLAGDTGPTTVTVKASGDAIAA